MPKNKVNYAKLIQGVQKVIERGDYPKFLKAVKSIKNEYSFRNTLLVYAQNPDATIVKGFCDWNKLGRGVKKNPRTIYIYRPIKSKKNKKITGQQNLDGKEEKERSEEGTTEMIEGITYKRVAVFDIGDTYLKKGQKRIPILDDVLDSDTTENLYNILLDVSPVSIILKDDIGTSKGYYSPKKQEIVLKSSLSQDDKTAVLIHELCHCLYDNFVYKDEREKSEIFVESVAFLVADYFNFDTSLCSFGYIVSWAKNDIKEFMNLSNKIKKTADKFIELIKNSEYKQQKISA